MPNATLSPKCIARGVGMDAMGMRNEGACTARHTGHDQSGHDQSGLRRLGASLDATTISASVNSISKVDTALTSGVTAILIME